MLTDEAIVMLLHAMLMMSLKIAVPILGAGVAIGLLVSIFQSVTSIQDQTLTFVPKIVVMLLVAMALLPWIVTKLMEYTRELLWVAGPGL